MKKVLIGFLALSVMLLQGCGFHLRGQYVFVDSMQPAYLDIENKEFKYELQDILEFGNLRITDDSEIAKSFIQFTNEEYQRTPVSLDDRGQATRYDLQYTVTYRVVNQEGDLLLDESTNTTSRVLDYDPNRQLQADSEEQDLREDMYKDLSNTVARRLAKVSGDVLTDELRKRRY